jgi:hypothetical protein
MLRTLKQTDFRLDELKGLDSSEDTVQSFDFLDSDSENIADEPDLKNSIKQNPRRFSMDVVDG